MTDHDLNKLLADVAGVEVFETGQEFNHIWNISEGYWNEFSEMSYNEWTPLTDHNQMAQVKAGLLQQGWAYNISTAQGDCDVKIFRDYPECYGAKDGDELRTISKAIAKMKEVSDE